MPRFLVFVELGILRHVVYAYDVLPGTCSFCGGGVLRKGYFIWIYFFTDFTSMEGLYMIQ